MIRNIVFDMGMVLMDYHPTLSCLRHAEGDAEKAQALRAAIFDHPDWVRLDGGFITEDELTALAQNRLEEPSLRALVPAIMTDWHTDALSQMEGMDGVVKDLHDRGFKLYVLSNAGVRFRVYQSKLPHVELFDGILVSAEEKMLKPDKAIFDRLCEKFAIKAEECLFIDDVSRNVEGAQKAGFTAYCFADGDVARLKEYLKALPDA
ncbi:MAG: HAD family phosphatase [Eubacteriales bacterium]|nr:HAD family phosphatase [Eubacteriales bacterium]